MFTIAVQHLMVKNKNGLKFWALFSSGLARLSSAKGLQIESVQRHYFLKKENRAMNKKQGHLWQKGEKEEDKIGDSLDKDVGTEIEPLR